MKKINITSAQARRLSSRLPLGKDPVVLPNGAHLVREVKDGRPVFVILSQRVDGTDVDAVEAAQYADKPVTLRDLYELFEAIGVHLQMENMRQAWATNEKLVISVGFWRPTKAKAPLKNALAFLVGSIRGNLDGKLSPKDKVVTMSQGMVTAAMEFLKEFTTTPSEQKGTKS